MIVAISTCVLTSMFWLTTFRRIREREAAKSPLSLWMVAYRCARCGQGMPYFDWYVYDPTSMSLSSRDEKISCPRCGRKRWLGIFHGRYRDDGWLYPWEWRVDEDDVRRNSGVVS